MENQINMSDQNAQQIGQGPARQPAQNKYKLKVNHLIVGAAVLIGFVVFGFGGYYLGRQSTVLLQDVEQKQNQPTPSSVAANGEKIIASEATVIGCKIKVTTNKREFYLNTGYDSVDPNTPKCYQFLLNKISPSGNFLVYQSISGGIDSQLIVYSVINRNNEGHNIGVFGSATIQDIGFLPGDKLVALMGIPGDFQTWSLFSLNLMELYKDYPNNYGKDNVDMFTGTESVEKTIMLPNKNKDYNGFTIGTDKVRVVTVGPKIELVEYNIGDL